MREITADDLHDIARGAAILGTGGGGDPYIGRLLALSAVREHGPVPLVPLTEVPDDAVVLPVAMMGAPTVMVEKLPSAEQVGLAARTLAGYLGKELTHIACAEAGGVNSLIPVVAAAQLGLPLVDADGMGRAFPELQMVLPTLYGIRATPMSIADEKGNRGVLDTVDNRWAERLARSATIDMGCSAMISNYAMSGPQARESLVPGTLSLCAELGALVRAARSEHADPVARVVERLGGRRLFSGKVVDVARRTVTGFARGEARLSGMDGDTGAELVLRFQNEHLVAERDGVVEASVPDLICTVERETGEAVTTEGLRFGQRVTVIAAPADPRWHTPEGIALAGPRYFGYDIDPIGVAG
ncbi:DUF917 domain-containing protein [Amycolatopsis mongoliensis]|uniref:DUF917 domain-containing protein n=1 Tax=Amycolatopsis mongoliensis TaxID=715475 RepID=A0A9Y2K1L5_9PSEU|nr:DUF917 domain-containing protein [Amycolatopsis sp. 4-36]WIY07611.1 DUF917 domain-containing protein [Amycolatopsis sp. 4-36]